MANEYFSMVKNRNIFMTFGIVTDGLNPRYLESVIDSILLQKQDEIEILVIGSKSAFDSLNANHKSKVKLIEFDESQKKGWITKKKNLIVNDAKGIYITFLHDYVTLCENWYEQCLDYLKKNRIDVGITQVLDHKGDRYFDWVVHPHNFYITDVFSSPNKCLLPYDVRNIQHLQYVPGYFFIARKDFMHKYPFDESLAWGEGEDVEWSFRWRDTTARFEFIPKAKAKLCKDKSTEFEPISGVRLLLLLVVAHRFLFKFYKQTRFDVRRFRRAIGLSNMN